MNKRAQQSLVFIVGVTLSFCPFALAGQSKNPASLTVAQAATAAPAGGADTGTLPENSAPEAKPKESPPETPEAKATNALFEHLQKYQIRVRRDFLRSQVVWTDGVIVEISNVIPPDPLGGFLNQVPSDEGVLAKWFSETFEKQLKSWHPAKQKLPASHDGTDEIVGENGTDHCFLNPIYVSYVLARYPDAAILMKTPADPVVFTVRGKICAVIVPWTKLPDGTPLS